MLRCNQLGTCALSADSTRPRPARPAGACHRCQVRRAPPAIPPVAELCARARRVFTLVDGSVRGAKFAKPPLASIRSASTQISVRSPSSKSLLVTYSQRSHGISAMPARSAMALLSKTSHLRSCAFESWVSEVSLLREMSRVARTLLAKF